MTSVRNWERLTFLLSVLVCTGAILIVSARWSARKAEVLTHSITNSGWCEKSDGINQKDAKLISQLVDSNTFMTNPINMFHISVHSAGRQAPWIFSILDRCHSISGLCRTIKYYNLPHCFLSESKCEHLKGFCTNFANMKQEPDAYALFFKVCHFLNKQKQHQTQHMITLHSNTCHNFEINNKWPRRFYSTAT